MSVKKVKGYKVFNPDWTCRGFQYEVGKTYKHDGDIEPCKSGFHFCINAIDCFQYYNFDSKNKVAEVVATGLVKADVAGDKYVTDEITIVRELEWQEVLELVNTGKKCTGLGNTGHSNSGSWNSGNRNSGDLNCGHRNSGYENSGDWNSGIGNSGYNNSGNYNSGDGNSGNSNSGHRNSGNGNSGGFNTGDYNSGYINSGSWNSGDRNSGNGNSGDWNSGNMNLGSYNSGDWNSGNGNSGVFCTKEPKIKIFDVKSDMTLSEWRKTKASRILRTNFKNNIWISSESMTDEEKEQYPSYETKGGYLKELSFKEACRNMWDNLTDKEKEVIKAIPNFDEDKFEEITGIRV